MSEHSFVEPSEDWPAEPQPVKYWSESYAFWAWDEQNDLTIYAHFQRHPDKPAMWRGIASVLRNGSVYAVHSYGVPRTPFGPGFEGCSITIERPHGLWRVRVEGAAQRQTQDEHERQCITDGPGVPILIDVLLSMRTPVWSLSHGASKEALRVMPAHYEQTGQVTGLIELGEEKFTLNCLGANDHSRGVRDTGELKDGGFFFNAVFPSGRSLTGIKMAAEPGVGELGYICNGDGVIRQATRVTPPDASYPVTGATGSFTVEAEGVVAKVNYEVTDRRILLTMVPPNYEHVGLIRGADTPLHYCDYTCRVELDGEVGSGSWEVARWSAAGRPG